MTRLPPGLSDVVPRETVERLDQFVAILVQENEHQNLISRSTVANLWDRHIIDSLQLLLHAPSGPWVDIGSGAGLPGLVVAIVRSDPMTLVEPRSKRAAFLRETAARLQLDHVTVMQSRIETAAPSLATVITARAVAGLSTLFEAGLRHAAPGCVWLLHKGRGAEQELAAARKTWQGDFRLVPSLTDPESSIVMARDVSPLMPSRPKATR